MTASDTPATDRTAESADMIETPADGDPAGAAAGGTVDKMDDGVDQLAADGNPASAGHGPVQDDPAEG